MDAFRKRGVVDLRFEFLTPNSKKNIKKTIKLTFVPMRPS